jgi:FkbM family methyltransferase
LTSLRTVVAQSGGGLTAAVLSGVYLYARLQARSGETMASPDPEAVTNTRRRRSIREVLATSAPARHTMRFKMRDGSRIRCRVADSGGLLSVHADRDYDVPNLDWPSLASVVDVGAHVGTFTVWAARRAPKARILAVEPNPRTFALLQQNIRDNGLENRVTAVNAAVAGEEGSGTLELVDHSLGTRLARAAPGSVAVELVTIESLLAKAAMDNVDMLKIDCEGMEYEVFGSMSRRQLSRIAMVACEYHPEPGHAVAELDALLERAGFRVERPRLELGVLWATR